MPIKLNGATSGSVELDVPAAVGSDLQLTLPSGIGTSFQTLRNSTTAGTLEFGNAPVLQIIYAETQVESQVTGQVYTDTNLTANITPLKADSDILVIINQQYNLNQASAQNAGLGIKILRDATTIYTPVGSATGPFDVFLQASGATALYFYEHKTLIYNDDARPSGTSQLTYKTQGRNYDASSTINFQFDGAGQDLATSTILLVELG